jgi:hypothetical protein
VTTAEQIQRAKWDLLLLDIENRTEQIRHIKTFGPRRLLIQGLTAGGVLLGAGAAVGAALTALLTHVR